MQMQNLENTVESGDLRATSGVFPFDRNTLITFNKLQITSKYGLDKYVEDFLSHSQSKEPEGCSKYSRRVGECETTAAIFLTFSLSRVYTTAFRSSGFHPKRITLRTK